MLIRDGQWESLVMSTQGCWPLWLGAWQDAKSSVSVGQMLMERGMGANQLKRGSLVRSSQNPSHCL